MIKRGLEILSRSNNESTDTASVMTRQKSCVLTTKCLLKALDPLYEDSLHKSRMLPDAQAEENVSDCPYPAAYLREMDEWRARQKLAEDIKWSKKLRSLRHELPTPDQNVENVHYDWNAVASNI
jgi:hypothetical protein